MTFPVKSALQALLLSADDKTARVLRRVLGELEIGIEQCSDPDAAIQKLTRQRFEAVIIDCASLEAAFQTLKAIHSAPANKRAILVVFVENPPAVKSAFERGAHFALLRSTSQDRTKSTFRAVRALMKRERRRHARIPIQLAVELRSDGYETIQAVSVDLGENGLAIKAGNRKLPSQFQMRFTLPGDDIKIESSGKVAWEGNEVQGIRFHDLSQEMSEALKAWVARQLLGSDPDDPPVRCTLTDLSLGGCYVRTESPFPVLTRLQLTMKVEEFEVQVDGIVRVMHPEAGMGVEFAQQFDAQRAGVQKFMQSLINTAGAVPSVEVRPGANDSGPEEMSLGTAGSEPADVLLSLFQTNLPWDLFQSELQKQRTAPHYEAVMA